MDSTIIENECIDELAVVAGVGKHVSAITEAAMRGEIDFDSALRERVALLEGLSEDVLQTVFDAQIKLTPGARSLVRTMQANGAKAVLVSGGFTFFTNRVAKAAGFDENRANTLEIKDGKLTGRVGEPILGANAKLESLKELIADMRIEANDVLAVGDGANDIPMLKEAGLGVAFCAKPTTAEAANVAIHGRDLRTLLYLQGYTAAEIID